MSFDLRHETTVAAPAETVWRLLTDFGSWPRWWKDCTAATRAERTPLGEGSKVELVVRPAGRERTLRVVVDLLSEGRSLTLVGQGWLFHAAVTWVLRPAPIDTARIRVHGAFSGLATGRLGVGRPLIESSLKRQVRGLGVAAERLV